MDQRYRNPRIWSNEELKQIANLFTGDVVNVSAGDDVDKQGSTYSEYFLNASSYTITNFGGATYRGFQCRQNEIELDLTINLPEDLKGKYDVVFNHTTLEHIFDVHKAFHNLCELSHDIVILVIPFCQIQHENEGYLDYWRFTPTCVRKLFRNEGLEVIYEAANDIFNTSVYLFFVASKLPQKWTGHLPACKSIDVAGSWVGQTVSISSAFQLLIQSFRAK